ncbi:putative Cys-rich domain protein [Opisthorchis viverrini]|uniref:Putative Cys-rich domain protein n=1 Tax=Opisthorchis viverrini TaxID=6198 RepID=A0A1S8WLA4_OPIVI|nr:putative Cys-rich domain protein [Opisthorchis viverrini]
MDSAATPHTSATTGQPRPQEYREWHDGIFDCTNDMFACTQITCCYPCFMCYMYHLYREGWATPMCMICPGLTLRAYHRAKHRVHGALFTDCFFEYFCTLCAACQLERDMKYIEATTGLLNV